MTVLAALVTRLTFTRILAAVFIANGLAMAVCNAARLPVAMTPWVWATALAVGWAMVRGARARRTDFKAGPGLLTWLAVFVLVIAAARVHYPLEWLPLPGNIGVLGWDDVGHAGELLGMTKSDAYPIRSPGNSGYLLSFYYAWFYPLAALKLGLGVVTLKDMLFLGSLGYGVLYVLVLLEAANSLLASRRQVTLLMFFCTAFGGLDWVVHMAMGKPFLAHHEWWQMVFSGFAQISSFYTALHWAPHHFGGFMACVVAFVLFTRARFPQRRLKAIACGLILVSGLYSSVFAIIGAVPLALPYVRILWRRLARPLVLLPVGAVFAASLPVLLDRPGQPGFVMASFRFGVLDDVLLDKLIGFPAWFMLVSVVELGAAPLLCLALWRHLSVTERQVTLAAVVFFASTYWIAFSGSNNYSMRGMLPSTFVLFFLVAKYHALLAEPIRRRLPARTRTATTMALAGILVLGTAGEVGFNLGRTRAYMPLLSGPRDLPDYRALARAPSRLRTPEPREREPAGVAYTAEKFLELPPDRLVDWELELMGPRVDGGLREWTRGDNSDNKGGQRGIGERN